MKKNNMKLLKSVGRSLIAAAIMGIPLSFLPAESRASTSVVQQDPQYGTVKGTVKSDKGEEMIGAVVYVVGTQNSAFVDFDGSYILNNVKKGATIRATLMGFTCEDQIWNGGPLNFVMIEEDNQLEELVVTAMGIMRKEKSLTYATQMVKADDLFKAPDANLVNSLEGKISGITITAGAGGAGGASKITLRGNKSIMGDNAPLIVVDGVPMTNSIRGQASIEDLTKTDSFTEGADPLSMINPDDIESMNVLKGANAAALYGSRAANGVIMITTKKGKEGKMEITFNSSTTAETPLLTPEIQNSYGGAIYGKKTGKFLRMEGTSWGSKLNGGGKTVIEQPNDEKYYEEGVRNLYLRGTAEDDIAEFFSTGLSTNNSIAVSGGTEKIQTYASYSNSYSQGMIESNKYSRNTFAFRQNYRLWDRLTLSFNVNYMQTKTKNRIGGGRLFNPIYDLYTANRDIDMDYYKKNYETTGTWKSSNNANSYWSKDENGQDVKVTGAYAMLNGPSQNWAHQGSMTNNPYWLLNKNFSEALEDRFFASFQANIEIIKGLNLQARVSLDHSKYNDEGGRYATTMSVKDMERYGVYWLNNSRTNEIYTDYLLSYNGQFGDDWSLSATAGYVGHTTKGISQRYYDGATTVLPGRADGKVVAIPTMVNIFYPQGTIEGVDHSKSESSNWDQAALATMQVGWQDKVFVDVSYRQDWYRPFRQFAYLGTPESYGYFGFGANAVLSDIFRMPDWFTYAKYRLSYSEVGNSIPNIVYQKGNENFITGAITGNQYATFRPIPETTKSFETGFETQFFKDCLNFDVTYYNSAMHNLYLTAFLLSGKQLPVNSGIIRNQGVEVTLGYDWKISRNWRWKTSANFSYNHNNIEEIYNDPKTGESAILQQEIAESMVQIRYEKGGKYGDMYIKDLKRHAEDVYDENGKLVNKKGDIKLTYAGTVQESETFNKGIGNMSSDYQLSWSNTFSYKDFTLYFLINGRIGGKVVSLTERYLDRLGVSKRTGDAREFAENYIDPETGEQGLYIKNGKKVSKAEGGTEHAMFINEGRDVVSVQKYYEAAPMENYVYDATNFRLRELSLGYTFRNLFGDNKNLSVSFVCRNLFFIYRDAPVDPDISLATGNGAGAFELFNMPSTRSFGLNLKLNL
ncbi:MAG: SusC/RagA family TonB-linked outer membrane protein [Bacteroidaceae bacterium]|nr:SusC/RagA family TonB-linked outer membrane protein [Bacteroidaceae bacterium]